jgi:3-hydroxyacyl-CoA dehydrogenase/enoyl-CoA hydratase/3-hydroxybutyryl-CoA epimerase
MYRLIETFGKPVVLAMTGFALGGGYELALACSYRILADDPKALVGLPEVNVGLLPGSGGTQRLPRIIGLSKAAEVLLEGGTYSPQKALAMGMVDAVAEPGAVIEQARTWLNSKPEPVRLWDKKGFRPPDCEGLLRQATANFFRHATAKKRQFAPHLSRFLTISTSTDGRSARTRTYAE